MEMRGPTQMGVPGGMGTQVETYHTNEHARANNETNQNIQNTMELEHAHQRNINITIINPIPTKPATNSFYNSWGDNLPNPKLASTVCLVLQTLAGGHNGTKTKNPTISKQKISTSLSQQKTSWLGIEFHQCNAYQNKCTGGARHHIYPSHTTERIDTPIHINWARGVAILSCNRVAHQVASQYGTRPDGTQTTLLDNLPGKNDLTIRILVGYRPCKSENGYLSVLQQHCQYQDKLTPDKTEHPRSAFWTDLQPILQEWAMQGNQIIMGLDANKDI